MHDLYLNVGFSDSSHGSSERLADTAFDLPVVRTSDFFSEDSKNLEPSTGRSTPTFKRIRQTYSKIGQMLPRRNK
jgi:hypothetical protein